jgi:CPA2 family monovalent cation:H+ antiporter-2
LLAAGAGLERGMVFDLLVVLAGAALVALLLQRLRLAVIPAFLITGALIGPKGFGLVPAPESLDAIAHLAIILLLFGVGLELHLSAVRQGMKQLLAMGSLAVLLCTAACLALGRAFGLDIAAALTLAMAFSLSSTAVVLRILTMSRRLHQTSGRITLAILVLQDMAVIGMLAALPAIVVWGGDAPGGVARLFAGEAWTDLLLEGVVRVIAVGGLVFAARWLLPRLLHESLRGGASDVSMIVGVAAALGAAIVAQALGFSLEMGAFIAGFVLAATPFRHHLSGQIGPLRDLFLAVFFTVLGMNLDPDVLVSAWWLILIAGLTLVAVKALVIAGVTWSLGATAPVALYVGLALAQAGEFSLVLLGEARDLNLLDDTTMATAVAIVVISLTVTPGLVSLGNRLAHRFAQSGSAPWIRARRFGEPEHDTPADPRHPVVIAGFGPTGRLIAERLEDAGISCVILELNPETVRRERRLGRNILLGNAANPEVLESVDLAHATAFVLTVPDEASVMRASALARKRAPNLFIVARVPTLRAVQPTLESGANLAIAEEMAAAEALALSVAALFDVPHPSDGASQRP